MSTRVANAVDGKFLRVTCDGGAPAQNDTALAVESNGFYELALDAGVITCHPGSRNP